MKNSGGKYAEVLQRVNAREGTFGPNIDFTVALDGVVSATRCNILSCSGNVEDPWISMAADHDPSLIIWGEILSIEPHILLKNNNGGINVYVSPALTQQPTVVPTAAPSKSPTQLPTQSPTMAPTTAAPSDLPSQLPSQSPTILPSAAPSNLPTRLPSQQPTIVPAVALYDPDNRAKP
jgi:hypothetical protein